MTLYKVLYSCEALSCSVLRRIERCRSQSMMLGVTQLGHSFSREGPAPLGRDDCPSASIPGVLKTVEADAGWFLTATYICPSTSLVFADPFVHNLLAAPGDFHPIGADARCNNRGEHKINLLQCLVFGLFHHKVRYDVGLASMMMLFRHHCDAIESHDLPNGRVSALKMT